MGNHRRWWSGMLVAVGLMTNAFACATAPAQGERAARTPVRDPVRPGITVLVEDSLAVLRGKRIALLTNQASVTAQGATSVDILASDSRVRAAGVQLVRLFTPEHGFRVDQDRTGLADERDAATGLMMHSLYGRQTMAPPDSLLRDLDALVFDLQDIGTRTWTYVGLMVYAMRAAQRAGIALVVLDRPNPLGGRAEAPFLDEALANPDDPTPERAGQAYALYPVPLRHGMTMGEMARMYAALLDIPVRLHVIPMTGWRRAMAWEQTQLPWVAPSPAMTSPTSARLYPALVAFEGANVSVGRGTDRPFQQVGAPWLNADSVVALLRERSLAGLRVEAVRFTPQTPTDNKFGGRSIPGVRFIAEDPERMQAGRLAATVLWAIARANGDSLRLSQPAFDRRFGDAAARAALVAADGDPDEVLDRMQPALIAWQQRMRPYLLYR